MHHDKQFSLFTPVFFPTCTNIYQHIILFALAQKEKKKLGFFFS